MSDLISREEAIDTLNIGAELLKRVLDDADIVGDERAKYEWGLGIIESYISDIEELPSVDAVPVIRCKDCKHRITANCERFGIKRYTQSDSFCSWAEPKETNNDH